MKYKIKHKNGTGIIEDVGGGVSMDDLIDVFLKEFDSWSDSIYSYFYNYNNDLDEHGPTNVVDTLVLEDGNERDINVSVIENSDSGSLSDRHSLGWQVFFSHAVSNEKGQWKFDSFELEYEFNEKYLQGDRNIDSESIISMYVYDNPENDEYIDIEGEFVECSGSGVDIKLYVNTKDGVAECDNFSVWREEMEDKEIDTSSKEEVKNIY